MEYCIEEFTCGNKSGRCIDNEKYHNEDGADKAQDIFLIFKTVGQVIRNGQAVICNFRICTKTFSGQYPVGPGAQD